MSFNIALANAYSGLSANSRLAEVVSRNVANATTEGYAAKRLDIGNRVVSNVGGGVVVNGVSRAEDAFLTADRRRAEARADGETAEAQATRRLSDLLAPEDGGDILAERFAALDVSLAAAVNAPDAEATRLQAIDAARGVALTLNELADRAGRIATQADTDVTRQVDEINTALRQIEDLNGRIREAEAMQRDATILMDERDRQIEAINGIVPVRATPADNGGVVITTLGGGLLFDQTPNLLTVSGATITLDGRNVTPSTGYGFDPLAGGTLEASRNVRDTLVPDFIADLDAIAADLVTRFSEPNVADPSLAPAAEGLFVLNAGVGPASQRVAVNPLILDDSRRLRDGVATTYDATGSVTGPAGHPSLGGRPNAANPDVIASMLESFRTPYTADGRTITEAVETITATWQKSAQTAEQTAAFARANADTLYDEEMRVTRVDTDAELRNLIEIEKSYAANAKVMSVIDDLIARLLEM
jgi:flagellar hook-associated protein 1 FlgK